MVSIAFLKYQTGQDGDEVGGRQKWKEKAHVGGYFRNSGKR